MRDHARPAAEPPARPEPHGPGLMLFAPTGEVISSNDDAGAWLDELAGDPLPIVVVGTLMRARAIAEERDRGSARRPRSRR